MRKWLQFRLSTLLLIMTASGIAVYLWLRFISPIITDVSIDDAQLVVHLLPDDPDFSNLADDSKFTIVFTSISIPLYLPLLGVMLLVFTFVMGRCCWNRLFARFRAWFFGFDAQKWDARLEEDVRSGILDVRADEAIREHRSGQSTEL